MFSTHCTWFVSRKSPDPCNRSVMYASIENNLKFEARYDNIKKTYAAFQVCRENTLLSMINALKCWRAWRNTLWRHIHSWNGFMFKGTIKKKTYAVFQFRGRYTLEMRSKCWRAWRTTLWRHHIHSGTGITFWYLPPWQQNIFSSIMATTGKALKQSVKVFHNFKLYLLLPEIKQEYFQDNLIILINN